MAQIFADVVTSSSTTKLYKLGTFRHEASSGKDYRYVQVSASSAGACANGTVMLNTGSAGTSDFVVSDDVSANKQNDVIGVGVGAIAKSSYGWIQVYGSHAAIKTDGGDDIADGDGLIQSATGDGECDSVAAGTALTHKGIGFATAADVDSQDTVAAFITLG
ncbi:MAG: hypothetical protein GY833_16385 [Aestuariibacter sp.]|nr:hypothetical protein [Aestuariibacter sp.]